MSSRGGFDAKAVGHETPDRGKAVETLVALGRDHQDKALVMAYIGQLVADGHAEWDMRDNGEVEIRLTSGETYLFSEATILRLA